MVENVMMMMTIIMMTMLLDDSGDDREHDKGSVQTLSFVGQWSDLHDMQRFDMQCVCVSS